jgi:hypothetical protein
MLNVTKCTVEIAFGLLKNIKIYYSACEVNVNPSKRKKKHPKGLEKGKILSGRRVWHRGR